MSRAFEGKLEAHNQVLVSTPFISSATYRIYVEVAEIPTSLVTDTGAAVTLLQTDIWGRIQRQKPSALNPWMGPKLVGADGRPLQVRGCKQLTVTIAGQKFESQVIIADSLTAEGILGLNLLQAHYCMIDLGNEILDTSKRNLSLPLESRKKDGNADALSCLPCSQCGHQDEPQEDTIQPDTTAAPVAAVIFWKETDEIHQLQVEDPDLQPIMEATSSHQPLSPELLRAKSRNCQRLFQLQDQLTLKGGLLYRKYIGADGKLLRLQLVVPMVLRKDILRDLNEGAVGGHLEEEKTRERLKERFYWPGHWGDVRDWCRTCAVCAQTKTPTPKQLRQKEQYDLKVHGKPFAVGDQVWLFNTAVPCGQARKFHRLWNRPYRVLERLSKVIYQVQHLRNHKKSVVHFDRLKSCHPGTQFPKSGNPLPVPGTPLEKDAHTDDHLELVEQDYTPPGPPARRYPVRQRQPPECFSCPIPH